MRKNIRSVWSIALVALLASLHTAACDNDPTGPDTPGVLAVQLTDAPVQDVTAVNVYIEGLKVKHVGEPEARFATDVGLVDLLQIQDSTMLLAEAAVEAGEYEYVMVELDQDRSNLVVNGSEVGIRIPSEKIKVFGPFEVDADMLTTVTLDFDAGESLQQLGNGEWLMTPVIVILGVQVS